MFTHPPQTRFSFAVLLAGARPVVFALAGLTVVSGCVAPPRPSQPVRPIPPRPLTAMTLPPLSEDAGFAGPETMPPAPAGTAVGGGHTVIRGDTLAGIARRYYGSPSAWKRIAEANPGVNPNRLTPGQRLVIP